MPPTSKNFFACRYSDFSADRPSSAWAIGVPASCEVVFAGFMGVSVLARSPKTTTDETFGAAIHSHPKDKSAPTRFRRRLLSRISFAARIIPGEDSFDIFCNDVGFQIHFVVGLELRKVRNLEGLLNHGDFKIIVRQV